MPELPADDRAELHGHLATLIEQAASLAGMLELDEVARRLGSALDQVRGEQPQGADALAG